MTAVPYSVQTRGVYRDASGNVGVGTTAPTERLSVAGTVESTSGGVRFPDGSVQTTARMSVPIGGVIDWWRPSASFSVPDRFQACDGSVVTDPDSPLFDTTLPDLTDKFVRGAASSTQVGETGGIETHSHAIDHDHPAVQSSAAADHAHQWAKWYTDYTGTDKYWVSFSDWGGERIINDWTDLDGVGNEGWGYYPIARVNPSNNDDLRDYTDRNGNHTHGIDIPAYHGSTSPVDNQPPHVGLLMIMRIK